MNRQQALEWLVENVVKWPVVGFRKRPHGWQWLETDGEWFLASSSNRYGKTTQSDWLAATDNMEVKHDD